MLNLTVHVRSIGLATSAIKACLSLLKKCHAFVIIRQHEDGRNGPVYMVPAERGYSSAVCKAVCECGDCAACAGPVAQGEVPHPHHSKGHLPLKSAATSASFCWVLK